MPNQSQEIKPEFSKTYRGCALVFLFCFSVLFLYLSVFHIDDIRIVPQSGNVFAWIKYGIVVLLDLAVIGVFAFANYYIINANIKDVRAGNLNGTTETDLQTTHKIKIAILFFAIVGAKIVFAVLAAVVQGSYEMLTEDFSSPMPWILLVFFFGIAIAMVFIFRYILRKFAKAEKILAKNGMDIFKGTVVDKYTDWPITGGGIASTEIGSGSMDKIRYTIVLDTGKKFENIQVMFYSKVNIGQKVEIHCIPEVGEILHFYII